MVCVTEKLTCCSINLKAVISSATEGPSQPVAADGSSVPPIGPAYHGCLPKLPAGMETWFKLVVEEDFGPFWRNEAGEEFSTSGEPLGLGPFRTLQVLPQS